MQKEFSDLVARAEGVLERVESLLPPPVLDPDWKKVTAARWRKRSGRGYLQAVPHPHAIKLTELVAVDDQKQAIERNTRQFVAGLPANNVLLTGSRGTGKSSLVKAMLAKYSGKGLRLIEVDKADLVDLPDIADRVAAEPFRFVIFCDDLTFDAGEAGYKALKVMLDGSIAGAAGNVVVYATSNRRHLLPEYFIENLETKHIGEEVHPGRIGRGEDLVVRALRSLDLVLSVLAGRLPRGGRGVARALRREAGDGRARRRGAYARGAAVGAATRLAQRPRRVAVRQELRRFAGPQVAIAGMNDLVRVAAAVLIRPDGQVLLAQRPAGKPYAGYWEFPGGKLEPGESPRHALDRELHEELGIVVRRASPWLVQEFVYPHAHVELHFFRVFEWDGELQSHDGQAFEWQTPGRYTVAPLLPANTRILAALDLPLLYGITCAEDSDEESFLARAARELAEGLRLVQLRDKSWSLARRFAFARELVPLARRAGARVLWNGSEDEARAAGCDGVHWTAATLRDASARPSDFLTAASCHTREELARAGELGLDFAVLGPVLPTPTHPFATPLGWERFCAHGGGRPFARVRIGRARRGRSRGRHRKRGARRCAAPRGLALAAADGSILARRLGRLVFRASGGSTPGMRKRSAAHSPRSMSLHRSEQNGRHFDVTAHSTGVPHLGQLTIRGLVIASPARARTGARSRPACSCAPRSRYPLRASRLCTAYTGAAMTSSCESENSGPRCSRTIRSDSFDSIVCSPGRIRLLKVPTYRASVCRNGSRWASGASEASMTSEPRGSGRASTSNHRLPKGM